MRRPLVAGNWKMHGTRAGARALASELLERLGTAAGTDVALCPPACHLEVVGGVVAGSTLVLGAQDVAAERDGAYTGEVSAEMLADCGCRMVIVGHSERRTLYGEGDEVVGRKFERAREAGLTPILCVGETLAERDEGRTAEVVRAQLDAVLARCGVGALGTAVLAYEPVWAIGTGRTASPAQAAEVHALLRGRVAAHSGEVAAGLRILYGGSVKPANAAELFAQEDIDGGLIGGASLQADAFVAICEAAA